jgi:uncharacterized protein YbjT (DUF2867 family)
LKSAAPANPILLAGATGLVGSVALCALRTPFPPRSPVWVVGRRAPADLGPPDRFIATTDFVGLDAAFAGVRPTAALCALGTTRKQAGSAAAFRTVDFDFPLRFARAARAAGTPVLAVVTAVGAQARSVFFYNRVKGDLEAALRELGFPTLHLLRPGLLLGERAEHRPAERWAARLAPLYTWALPHHWRPVAARAVGRALARAATDNRPGVHVWQGTAFSDLRDDTDSSSAPPLPPNAPPAG